MRHSALAHELARFVGKQRVLESGRDEKSAPCWHLRLQLRLPLRVLLVRPALLVQAVSPPRRQRQQRQAEMVLPGENRLLDRCLQQRPPQQQQQQCHLEEEVLAAKEARRDISIEIVCKPWLL